MAGRRLTVQASMDLSCPSAQRPIANWSLHPQRARITASVDALRWPVPANCVADCVEDESPAACPGLALWTHGFTNEIEGRISIHGQCGRLSFALFFWEQLDPSSHIAAPRSFYPELVYSYEYSRLDLALIYTLSEYCAGQRDDTNHGIRALVQTPCQVRNNGSLVRWGLGSAGRTSTGPPRGCWPIPARQQTASMIT